MTQEKIEEKRAYDKARYKPRHKREILCFICKTVFQGARKRVTCGSAFCQQALARRRSLLHGRKYKEAATLRARRYYTQNRIRALQYARVNRWKTKLQVLTAYGGKCACCGEANSYFLTIDHINNDGAEARRLYPSVSGFYRKIIREGYPKDLQVLCYNCNCAKGHHGGICPHLIPSSAS